jgi:hypothetical protein
MPYIGNDIQYGELTSQTFTGDGSTVAFTMGYTVANPTSILVTSGNVVQEPTVAYTVSGTTLTFTSAPENADTIHVRYLGRTLDVAQTAIVQDADQDTKIQVEESADEDTIRFDIAGAEDFTMTANTFTAASGSTIAAQALTATTIGSSGGVTITGTTPTLTIGDAGAEDTKIVFSGNAQNYYIGLDDTDDDFKIGLGSAVGTTAHMVFDETGAITKPLQPSVFARITGDVADVTGDGTDYIVAHNSEVWDQNGDFNVDNYTFTAPVTGKYAYFAKVFIHGITSDDTKCETTIVASNRTFSTREGNPYAQRDADNQFGLYANGIVDMDALDTLTHRIKVSNGTKTIDTSASTGGPTSIQIWLVG